jgi:hypothetical protein
MCNITKNNSRSVCALSLSYQTKMEGRCQCGQIKFTTPLAAPQQLLVCHCTECRHQSSSTYGMTAIFPSFDIPSPFPDSIAIYTRPNSSGETKGFFCTKCGSRLMHQSISRDGTPAAAVSFESGCLEGITKEIMRGAVHIWTKSAVVDIPVMLKRMRVSRLEGVSVIADIDCIAHAQSI